MLLENSVPYKLKRMILYTSNEGQTWKGQFATPRVTKTWPFFPRRLQFSGGMGTNINHYDTKCGLPGKCNVERVINFDWSRG